MPSETRISTTRHPFKLQSLAKQCSSYFWEIFKIATLFKLTVNRGYTGSRGNFSPNYILTSRPINKVNYNFIMTTWKVDLFKMDMVEGN